MNAMYDALVDGCEKLGQVAPRGSQLIFGGVHVEKFILKADTVLISHCHIYDHPSILAYGIVELWTPLGELERFTGPTEVQIAAGVKHALHAITDAVWYCIHAGEPQVQEST